jgi:hypothetical protein
MCAIADNKYVLFVISPLASEEGVTVPEKRVQDRRIQKTQRLLHEALFSLIHEKSYDAIVVKEILDRANVGRSTFYTGCVRTRAILVFQDAACRLLPPRGGST